MEDNKCTIFHIAALTDLLIEELNNLVPTENDNFSLEDIYDHIYTLIEMQDLYCPVDDSKSEVV